MVSILSGDRNGSGVGGGGDVESPTLNAVYLISTTAILGFHNRNGARLNRNLLTSAKICEHNFQLAEVNPRYFPGSSERLGVV